MTLKGLTLKVERFVRDCSILGKTEESKQGHKGGPQQKFMEERREARRKSGWEEGREGGSQVSELSSLRQGN